MSILGVMGPIMVGPSSSHTAGAARLGRLARLVYGQPPAQVEVRLFNSFAETGKGHGTDKALAGGILGLEVDDERLKKAFDVAREQGVAFSCERRLDPEKHPNYVEITFRRAGREEAFTVAGVSLGGGSVQVTSINGFAVEFSGRYDVLLLTYQDVPGMVGFIGDTLGSRQINIAHLHISRDPETDTALALLKLDGPCPTEVVAELRAHAQVRAVTYIPRQSGGYGSAEED